MIKCKIVNIEKEKSYDKNLKAKLDCKSDIKEKSDFIRKLKNKIFEIE
jgi:hypothetical protein